MLSVRERWVRQIATDGKRAMQTAIHQLLVALTLLSATSVTPARARTPSSQPAQTFRSSVDVVSIQASVRDKTRPADAKPDDR